ncbi:hypothetical protein H5410_036884 [Solanum commersonii]|uniref:Uncharacterized protein n=1 Tax=Solanum commersonii TaxID=4109 RepID=A0A9J5Y8P4_SOLCO|nr:hypothetical protein H5410_036884 [Solanum commersonii]
MKAKLSNWKMNFLSQVGRLTLINTTLVVIPAYTMQYFTHPKMICKDIDKIQRNFLWPRIKISLSLPISHGNSSLILIPRGLVPLSINMALSPQLPPLPLSGKIF